MEQDIEKRLRSQDFIDPEMIKAAFDFWYSDNNHLRSPFPFYIRNDLKIAATNKFLDWSQSISGETKEELNDEILAERFEEIIFELALNMVITEDEKLTVRYPFMPRIGDVTDANDPPAKPFKSRVIDRRYIKRGDQAFLRVKMKSDESREEWETEFELPE